MAEGRTEEVVLRAAGVSKSFPGTQALRDVDLEIRRGEIHALAGANGSGKSTLVKILAGVLGSDAGEIHAAADIHVVHQDPAVFPDLSVADNLALGRGYETDLALRIRWRAVRRRTAEVLERFGIDARPETPVAALSPSARAMVGIARALQDQEGRNRGVLVLDEPTAALPEPEAELLLAALRRYAAAGQSMLFVSHDLDEVLGLADRTTVLRDGRVVATVERSQLDHARLVELITGRPETTPGTRQVAQSHKPTVLEVLGLTGSLVREVDLDVHGGEILGLAGLVGSGVDEILRCVFGAQAPRRGEIFVNGIRLRPGRIADAIANGIAYVPGERSLATFPELTVRENLSIVQARRYWRGFMDRARERRDAREAMERFTVRAGGSQPMRTASGGNQQKVVLARWLQRSPRTILLEEPTQGVDVGARAEIYAQIRRAANAGAAVVVASVDFEELERLCNRALVVNEGRVVAELNQPHLDHETLTKLAYAKGA